MTPSEIEALANTLVPYGISVCEIHDDQRGLAVSLRLRMEPQTASAQRISPPASSTAIAETVPSNVLRSPGMGRFAARHPLQDSPVVAPGQQVAAGQTLGYLLADSLIGEVTASQAGVLGRLLVAEGGLLGYGDAVYELA